ncbi:MAG: diguanylate cyclase [bacterium]
MFLGDSYTQHPLYALILSIMIIMIVIENSIQKGKVMKTKLILSFLNTFLVGILWVGQDIYDTNIFYLIYNIIMILEYVVFAGVVFFISYCYIQKMKNYNNFIDSFKNTTFNVFYLTDKKDRVKEISESLLREIGISREEIIGKRFFDVVSQRIRFFKLDETEINNDMLISYYKQFPKTVLASEEFKREIYFYNKDGQTVILTLLEKPIFFYGKYKGRMNVGQRKDNLSLLAAEKELIHSNNVLQTMQHKFIATLELTESGVFFHEIDQSYIWCNDILVKNLRLNSNTINVSDFHSYMHPDDLYAYQGVLEKLTPESPTYTIKYRFKVGYNYILISERGKRIFEDQNSKTILGYIDVYEGGHFAKTNYKHLDEVKSYNELVTDVNILYNNNMNFYIVALRATNLPDINNQHSREIGDMILAEYIKQIKTNFLTESSDIYRVSGIDFVFTITDGRKVDLFKKCIESNNEIMNLKVAIGGSSVILEINCGIAQSYNDGATAQDLINNSRKALTTSLNPQFSSNYAYYKDMYHG